MMKEVADMECLKLHKASESGMKTIGAPASVRFHEEGIAKVGDRMN